MARGRAGVVLAVLVVASVLGQDRGATSARSGSMTSAELGRAADAVRAQVDGTEAVVERVTVRVATGTVTDGNVGRPCTSGRLLHVTVAGRFPEVVTTGTPVLPGAAPMDVTVRRLLLTVDAASGVPCLLGVGTTAPRAHPSAVEIDLRRR